jgi:hypothetical protein
MTTSEHSEPELHIARWELLEQINELTKRSMVILSFVWLGLLVIDFMLSLRPLLQMALAQLDIGGESRTGARIPKKSKISAVGYGSAISGASSKSSQGACHITSATSAL